MGFDYSPVQPQVASNHLYDVTAQKWRPVLSSDFANGGGGGDAFGRTRVSNPEMIFNSKQIFDNQSIFWDDIQFSGTGTTSTYNQNTASSVLAVSTSAGKRIRQTFMRFNYQPSKSQLVLMTGVLKKSGGSTGITSRIGLFDENNGLFLENNGGTIRLVRRTNVTGTPTDNPVAQSSWSLDKLDGTGPSGITIDFTKTQIFVIDFEWLGVGRVRFGFNINGITYYVHEMLNANNLSNVYMSTPNLPLRYEIANDGNGAASSLECICSAVISEGGKEEVGINNYISTAGTAITATKSVNNALLAMRLKSGNLGATIDILNASVLASSNDNYEWNILMNPSGIGSLVYSGVNSSSVEKAIAPDGMVISGGLLILGGYSSAKSDIQGDQLKNLLKLGSSITGLRDTIVLSCRPLGVSNATVYAGLTFREV